MFETNNENFFQNYFKTTGVVLTALIDACNNFNGKIYVDDKNQYYMSVNYGGNEIITVYQPYSLDLYNKILNEFPNAVGIDFVNNGYVVKDDKNKYDFSYDYKFQGSLSPDIKTTQSFTVKLITDNDVELAKQYDDLYLNFLRPNHGARLANNLKYSSETNRSSKNKVYIAFIKNIPIGFILAYYNPEYFAWYVGQITIEKDYQQKGYGTALLTEVTKDNMKPEHSLYYTGVSEDNIASRKTAEKAGYTIVTSRMSVSVKK